MDAKQNNYVLVGPSSERFKGGIAQFTSHLAEKLSKETNLHFYSWYQPYPAFMTSRDFADKASKTSTGNLNANFLLGYMNPISWWRFVKELMAFRPETVCITWVHPVQAPVFAVLTLMIKFMTKSKVVFICHNILPHESFKGDRILTRIGLAGADRLIVHGVSERDRARALFKNKKITSLFLPLHNFFSTAVTPDNGGKKPKSKKLRLLFFGVIRYYKGLDILIRAMAIAVKQNPNISLRIVGEKFFKKDEAPDSANPALLIESLALGDFVETDFRYVPNEEVPAIFEWADVAVFPYRSATQSGPITIAYSYNVPVISTRTGGIPDVVEEGVSGYLVEANDEKALAEGILKYADHAIKPSDVKAFAKRLSWDNYIIRLLN